MLKKSLACGLLLSAGITQAAEVDHFDAAQTQNIEKIVHQYLVEHPQVLAEAANALSQQQQAQWQTTANQTVPKLAQQLFADSQSPSIGNSQAPISLVEFFDYQCPHCKDMGPQVEDLLKKDANLRVIFKMLPIFGKNSEFAAKASIAAQKQGKFMAFHQALLSSSDRLTRDKVLAIAKQVGLNTQTLLTDINNLAIAQELETNYQLAKQLNLTGTPGFIVAKVTPDKTPVVKNALFIPGAVPGSVLAEAVAEASRAKP